MASLTLVSTTQLATNRTLPDSGDWIYYKAASLERRSGGGSLFSDITVINNFNAGTNGAGNDRQFSWTNGTPTATGTNVTGNRWQQSYNAADSSGQQITCRVDSGVRTYRVHVGYYAGTSVVNNTIELEVSLSDGSATPISSFPTLTYGADKEIEFIIDAASATDNQTITIAWRNNATASNVARYVSIRAAEVTDAAGGTTGIGTTSQAQTSAASGVYTLPPVTGTATSSQAQTSDASGVFTALGVSGDAVTSQAQTSSASGAYTLPQVTGTATGSQAQTSAADGAYTLPLVDGTAISSQAQTISATGVFVEAGTVNGVGSTSQAQTSNASGVHVAPVAPVSEIRGGGIDHQVKRRKATLSDKPNQHLDQIIAKAFKTVFGELTDKKAPKTVQKQANKIVSEYTEEYRPKFDEIDWFAFNQDLEAVQRLFALYQREIADARQTAENKRIFDIIENDNLEFLLMH